MRELSWLAISLVDLLSEAVSGLVGRADVGAGLLYLASWLSYHHGCPTQHRGTRWSWILLSMLFAALSMFTKEQGLTVIGVCALYDVIIVSRIRLKDFFLSARKVTVYSKLTHRNFYNIDRNFQNSKVNQFIHFTFISGKSEWSHRKNNSSFHHGRYSSRD